jgi:hypothetical protein
MNYYPASFRIVMPVGGIEYLRIETFGVLKI